MPLPKLIDKAQGDQRLDRYELIGEIASGGMATVFLARVAGAGGFQRFFAIKRLHPNLASEPEFVQMFLDEARLAASIHHPHVVPILEVGTSDAGYYVVMEYIEGDTLARLAARAASTESLVPPPVALRVVLDALAGLHAAHELSDAEGHSVGLVHRDVSPQNILVGVDGSSRLTDFGVARATSRLANTQSGTLKGKLAYMPPEQAQGSVVDRRADIFAMAIVLWEVLAGQRLFKGGSEAETLRRLLFAPIPRLAAHAPMLPPQLTDVLARALERSPDDRFGTAADFSDALERCGLAPASPREVAAYVQSVIGQEVQEQRAAVRAWLAQSEASQASSPTMPRMSVPSGPESGPRSRTSIGNMAAPTPGAPESAPLPKRSLTVVLVPVAAVVLLVAGLAGWALTRSPGPAAPAPAAAASSPAPVVAAPPPPAASPATPSAAAPAASDDAMPVSALPATPVGGRFVPGGKPLGKKDPKDPEPAKTPAAPPAAPPPAAPPGDDGYKNPYR